MLKRRCHENCEDELGNLLQQPKRQLLFKKGAFWGFSQELLESVLVPQIQKVVQEEVGKAIRQYVHPNSRTSVEQGEKVEGRGIHLKFVDKLPSHVFTGSRIEAMGGGPVKIVLVDAVTKTPISHSSYSSLKIEIIMLDGDFGFDEHEDWSQSHFKEKIVREREGKRKLLIGELNLTLRDGVGLLGNIVVTDNSSWVRCGKFRLGARVVDKTSGVSIREGISEAFKVKDHRGESSQKHYPPASNDEIWRLNKISKDGKHHERLASQGIRTVGDFLRYYMTNPTSLRQLLHGRENIWRTVVDHASTCVVNDDEFYTYHSAADGVHLLFNSVYKLVGAAFDGESYQQIGQIPCGRKQLVEVVKRQAYKNVNSFVLVPHDACPSWPLTGLQTGLVSRSPSVSQHLDGFPLTHQASLIDCNQTSPLGYYNHEVEAQSSHSAQLFNSVFRNSFRIGELLPMPCNGENICPPCSYQAPILPNNHLTTEDLPPFPISTTLPPINHPYMQGNSMCPFPTFSNSGLDFLGNFVHFPVNGRNRVAWCKIKAAVKWRLLATRLSARRARCVNYCFH